jgi:hypothetical protein
MTVCQGMRQFLLQLQNVLLFVKRHYVFSLLCHPTVSSSGSEQDKNLMTSLNLCQQVTHDVWLCETKHLDSRKFIVSPIK